MVKSLLLPCPAFEALLLLGTGMPTGSDICPRTVQVQYLYIVIQEKANISQDCVGVHTFERGGQFD